MKLEDDPLIAGNTTTTNLVLHMIIYTLINVPATQLPTCQFPDTTIMLLLDSTIKARSSHRRCSVRKGVLRNFAKFIVKHLCQSLSLNKVAGAFL